MERVRVCNHIVGSGSLDVIIVNIDYKEREPEKKAIELVLQEYYNYSVHIIKVDKTLNPDSWLFVTCAVHCARWKK